MAGEVYKVGTLRDSSGNLSTFLFQATNPTLQASKAEGKDGDGNRKVTQHYNQVLKVDVRALIPRDTSIPVQGDRVTLEGIVVPAFNADGSVASGTFEVADPDGSGSGAAATLEFEVTGEVAVTMENEKITEISFAAERGLVNGHPAALSSSGA